MFVTLMWNAEANTAIVRSTLHVRKVYISQSHMLFTLPMYYYICAFRTMTKCTSKSSFPTTQASRTHTTPTPSRAQRNNPAQTAPEPKHPPSCCTPPDSPAPSHTATCCPPQSAHTPSPPHAPCGYRPPSCPVPAPFPPDCTATQTAHGYSPP